MLNCVTEDANALQVPIFVTEYVFHSASSVKHDSTLRMFLKRLALDKIVVYSSVIAWSIG